MPRSFGKQNNESHNLQRTHPAHPAHPVHTARPVHTAHIACSHLSRESAKQAQQLLLVSCEKSSTQA
jgi:hypothetical protein